MSEARIGRVFVASLHQGIADILPTRLEFYENWLTPAGLRNGTIGPAPLNAVLSFLRREGDVYQLVTSRAGDYAALWTVGDMSGFSRGSIGALPAGIRARMALRLAARLIRDSYPGSRALVKLRRGAGSVDIRGSVFCEVRDAPTAPLCGFYSAAIAKVLDQFRIRADARISRCRALEGRGCLISVVVQPASESQPAVAA